MGNSTDKHGDRRTSRRRFVKAVALAAAAPVLSQAGGGAPAKPAPLEAAADALAEAVRARHGRHLTPRQLKHIRQEIHHSLQAAQALGQVKLTNGDEPAFTFSAEVP